MKPKKKSMPSNERIIEFWCSTNGKEILEKYNIKPYGIHSLTIDAGEECWCCNSFCCEGYYEGWKEDKNNNKWSGDRRERCHIVSKLLGGSYECDNLFLMCAECHRRAPNTKYPNIFFEWVVKANRKSIQHKKDTSNGLYDVANELFNYNGVLICNENIRKFVTEFYSEKFSKYCQENISSHGFGERYNPDLLASELGLYKQYCVENKSILFQ